MIWPPTRARWSGGYETHPGYFAQDHREQFDSPNNTAEGWIWGFCADQSIGYVRGNLGMVLFSGDDVEKRLGDLSGGEAARLIFAKLAIAQPNVLVLDEPTNHLDLESIEALVEGLQAFPGALTSSNWRCSTASSSSSASMLRSDAGTAPVNPGAPCTSKRMTCGTTPMPPTPGNGAGARLMRKTSVPAV